MGIDPTHTAPPGRFVGAAKCVGWYVEVVTQKGLIRCIGRIMDGTGVGATTRDGGARDDMLARCRGGGPRMPDMAGLCFVVECKVIGRSEGIPSRAEDETTAASLDVLCWIRQV